MKKACLVVQTVYQNNEIFNGRSPLNRDNCLAFFHELKKQFLKVGIDLQTQDKCTPEEAAFILYNEVPKQMTEVLFPEKSAVLLFESELIRPDNWSLQNHERFWMVFTWSDDLVDNRKYFKFNFTGPDPIKFKKFSEKQKFCTLISGNKHVKHPLELYSKRIEAIRWFEKHHPEKFEFYGIGWDAHTFNFKVKVISKVLNRIKPLSRLLAKKWVSYRGPIDDKLKLLQDFRFSVCYENARDINGYITEKIFDSFAAGCIPVYWGAPNIADFIPKQCMINKNDFATYESLFSYLENMSESDYNSRLDAIGEFLESEKYLAFTPAYNAKIIVERLARADSR